MNNKLTGLLKGIAGRKCLEIAYAKYPELLVNVRIAEGKGVVNGYIYYGDDTFASGGVVVRPVGKGMGEQIANAKKGKVEIDYM